ncbi:MAG: hypothetical protein HOK62_05345 [Verrucomicrobiales bacterium]|nr:hypothetical protein [Verrucomicrobiales bacterium]
MSAEPDNELSLDLQFLPDWAQEDTGVNKYANHKGEQERPRGRKGGWDDRRPPRGDRKPANDRRPTNRQAQRGDRNKGGPRGDRRQGGGEQNQGRGNRDARQQRGGKPQRPEVQQLDIKVDFVPDTQGVESIAKEIRLTGRAYPLFQIALLVLERPARYSLKIRTIRKSGKGKEAGQQLFTSKLDDTVWLNRGQAERHTFEKHFDQFYATEKNEIEAPKGNFTFVAQCGFTDTYLGPPNHHDYQNKLVQFHADHLARVPFEKFKSRIRIVKDEEAVNAWIEQSKWRTIWKSLQTDEPIIFARRDEVQTHFRAHHAAGVVDEVETATLTGNDAKAMRDPRLLAEYLRDQWHRQKHFPMQLSTHLSKMFSGMGLQFFKKDKKVTHVSVARPNYLDVVATPVSDGVRRIVEFVEATPNCTRRLILENLAGLEHVEPKEGEVPPPAPEQTEEQKQLISDLHWLIHQGHVLDFANGVIETAKKPRPKEEKKKESRGEVSSVEKDAPAETKAVVEEAKVEANAESIEEAPKATTSEDSVPKKTTDE